MQANTNESQLLPPHVFSLLPSLPLLYNCQYRTHGLQFKYKRIRARPNSNTMFNFEQIAERKIVRAIERGEFENLKGRGLPIHLDDDVHVPKELRIGFRILKNAGISPGEVQVLNEINKLKQEVKLTEDKNYKQLLIHQISILHASKNL